MTMTALLTEPESSTEDDEGGGVCHIYCNVCYPNGEIAFCGADLTGYFEGDSLTDYDEDDCVVCIDMGWQHVCE